ncbi:MAG: sugar transferase [Chloroflexi bacterium]|nr:sugar transferase [Chloroflexota bacterium]
MQAFVRRALDLTVAAAGLLLLSVPVAIVGILIKVESPGPVFFRQERAGRGGKPFRVWKFRTMVDGSIRNGLKHTVERNDARITRVGKFLRELSIDELPQLINVLVGEMSLVGPRPTYLSQVARYTAEQRRRLAVKPGITSLAAVSGRNRIRWDVRIALDVRYVDQQSLWLDLKIMARTFWVAFVTREGIYADAGPNDDFGATTLEKQA